MSLKAGITHMLKPRRIGQRRHLMGNWHSQPPIQALDDASFKQFLTILQQAQCDGPTQIKVTRNLAAWSLKFNAASRCVQTILFRSWMTCSCWEEVTTNIVKCLSFLRTFYWICPWMSVSYLIIFYHCPVWTACSPEMMTCILKAHYINLTSTQMRQLLGVYQFAELREEALVTTFFRIIVPLCWSSHDGSWCWVFSSQVLDQNRSMCPFCPRTKNPLTVLIRGLVSWLVKKFSSNTRIS